MRTQTSVLMSERRLCISNMPNYRKSKIYKLGDSKTGYYICYIIQLLGQKRLHRAEFEISAICKNNCHLVLYQRTPAQDSMPSIPWNGLVHIFYQVLCKSPCGPFDKYLSLAVRTRFGFGDQCPNWPRTSPQVCTEALRSRQAWCRPYRNNSFRQRNGDSPSCRRRPCCSPRAR